MKTSAVKNIAPETLCEIFHWSCSDDIELYSMRTLFSLSAVSSSWRTAASHDPHLWSKIRVGPKGTLPLLERCVARSARLPLAILWDVDSVPPDEDVINILGQISMRIRALIVANPRSTGLLPLSADLLLPLLTGQLPELVRLAGPAPLLSGRLSDASMPLLRTLRFTRGPSPVRPLPRGITSLTLPNILFPDTLLNLQSLPQLQELTLSCVRSPGFAGNCELRTITDLTCIYSGSVRLLGFLTIPSLRRLSLSQLDAVQDATAVSAFLLRSRCNVEDLAAVECDPEFVEGIMASWAEAATTRITVGYSVWSSTTITSLVESLVPAVPRNQNLHTVRLPHLLSSELFRLLVDLLRDVTFGHPLTIRVPQLVVGNIAQILLLEQCSSAEIRFHLLD